MEIKVTMLGTAGSTPTKWRSLPGVALSYDGNILLFDCGEGTQMQMIKYGINFSRIRAIFITHAHGDHIIGVAGLIRTLAMNKRQDKLSIFVPRGQEGIVKSLMLFDKALIGYQIDIIGVGAGTVYKGKGFSVSAFKLSHTISTYGYAFREDDRIRFIVEKSKKLGLKGEMYSEIQKKGKLKIGKKTVKLEDITRVQYGKKVVYATDTRPVRQTVSVSKGADLLIHETSYADSESDLARQRGHCTAPEAAAIAKEAKVKALVLTHISSRYSTADALEAEARKIFKATKAANDGDVIIL